MPNRPETVIISHPPRRRRGGQDTRLEHSSYFEQFGLIEKTNFSKGPWNSEPDKVQWIDKASKLHCLIIRADGMGHLCGYVGLPAGHLWHGIGYEDLSREYNLDVHGGLTYSGPFDEIEPELTWWLGFDCAHAGDLSPGIARLSDVDKYRSISFVRKQCRKLARQIFMATRKPQPKPVRLTTPLRPIAIVRTKHAGR